MAINIPYMAIPSALLIDSGRSIPAAAPTSVPRAQPIYGIVISPYIYFAPIDTDETNGKDGIDGQP